MPSLGCLWNRRRLGRFVDGALDPRRLRSAAAQVAHCAGCAGEVERLRRLRRLNQEAEAVPDPDWSGFWPAVRVRIASEAARPIRESWWLPLWKPVWGHPRLALGSLTVSILAAALILWPAGPGTVPQAIAAPVEVQDVSSPDPNRSVMVYSSPDDGVTVIWVFNPAEQDEQS